MVDRLRVSVENGKYTLVQPEDGGAYAERYGERWRDFCGDNFVLCLGQEVEGLRKALSLACMMLFPHEPGDSRAVSPEFVALSAIASGKYNDSCWEVVDEVAKRLEKQG